MKSSLLPNIHLFETKPGKDNEGMFVCITESGKELLKELKRDRKKNINEKIEIINEINRKRYHIFKDILRDKSMKWIKRIKKGDLGKSQNTKSGYKLIIKGQEYFIKKSKKKYYNGYKEMIGLKYLQNKIGLLTTELEKIYHINIEILSPLYGTYNKKTEQSIIVSPFIQDYITIKDVFSKDNLVSEEEKGKIIKIIEFIQEYTKNNQIGNNMFIQDIEEKNIAFKRNNNSKITIIIHDPCINPKSGRTATKEIHELLTRNP